MRSQNNPHPSLSHVFPLHSLMAPTCVRIEPLHPEISIYILHTVLSAFWKVLTRRICLTVKSLFCCWPFSLFSWPQCVIQRWYSKEMLDASQSLEGKGLIIINPSGWRGELRVNFFPINNKTSIIHPKLWMWSESKHFTCSCLSRFKIKIFWFANSVEFVILRTLQSTIQTRADSIHQLLVDWCSKKLTVAFFQLLIGHELQCSVWHAKNTRNVTLVK